MRSRRKRYLVAFLALLIAYGGIGIKLAQRPIPPTREKFEQVRVGMTRDEIIRTVGVPPGDYSGGEYSGLAAAFHATGWVIRETELIVYFDDDEIATKVEISMAVPVYQPPFWERLRDSIGY